jgi:hypothetical protein
VSQLACTTQSTIILKQTKVSIRFAFASALGLVLVLSKKRTSAIPPSGCLHAFASSPCVAGIWYLKGGPARDKAKDRRLLSTVFPSQWRYCPPPPMALDLSGVLRYPNPILRAPRRYVSDDVRNTSLLSRCASQFRSPAPFLWHSHHVPTTLPYCYYTPI